MGASSSMQTSFFSVWGNKGAGRWQGGKGGERGQCSMQKELSTRDQSLSLIHISEPTRRS
eukprot:2970100-Prymnesium_polylepis.1